jgi:hypothetical protein
MAGHRLVIEARDDVQVGVEPALIVPAERVAVGSEPLVQPTARRENDGTVITVTDLRWAGQGWRTTGDALLALSAAARAREQRRIAREEMVLTS